LNCDERQDLIMLYLTDDLSSEESAQLRRHLATGCPTCAGYLAEAQAVLAALPLALDPVTPRAAAKRNLMDRVADSAEANRMADSWALRIFRVLVPAAVAAGVAIVATHAVVMSSANYWQRQAELFQTMAQGQDREVQFLRAQMADQKNVIRAMESPGLKLVELEGGKLQPSAVARLLWDQKAGTWSLLTQNVTPPKTGKNYVLWYINTKNTPTRAGSFNVDSMGCAAMTTTIPKDVGTLAVAAVTDEPIGSVGGPTGSIQMVAKLQ
jgi:anti-sigma-K factor RskA